MGEIIDFIQYKAINDEESFLSGPGELSITFTPMEEMLLELTSPPVEEVVELTLCELLKKSGSKVIDCMLVEGVAENIVQIVRNYDQ